MNIIAPIILRAANIDWKVISEAQPNFNIEIVPRKNRRFFLLKMIMYQCSQPQLQCTDLTK